MSEGLFIEAEMTHTATSPKPAPAWVTIHQTGKSEEHCIAYMNLNRLGMSLNSSKSGINLFQAAWMVSVSSRQLVWFHSCLDLGSFKNLLCSLAPSYLIVTLIFYWFLWEGCPMENFRCLLKLLWVVNLSAGWDISISVKIVS